MPLPVPEWVHLGRLFPDAAQPHLAHPFHSLTTRWFQVLLSAVHRIMALIINGCSYIRAACIADAASGRVHVHV